MTYSERRGSSTRHVRFSSPGLIFSSCFSNLIVAPERWSGDTCLCAWAGRLHVYSNNTCVRVSDDSPMYYDASVGGAEPPCPANCGPFPNYCFEITNTPKRLISFLWIVTNVSATRAAQWQWQWYDARACYAS